MSTRPLAPSAVSQDRGRPPVVDRVGRPPGLPPRPADATPVASPATGTAPRRGTRRTVGRAAVTPLLPAVAVVTITVIGCAPPAAGTLPDLAAPSAAAASAAITPPVTTPAATTPTGPEPMSRAPLTPLPTSRPTSTAQRAAASVAVARHYLSAAVIALRGGDPSPLAAVAGPACACRSLLRDAARFRPTGGVAGFDVLLAAATEVDALGTDVSVIRIDYTVPAHVEPPGAGTPARPVAAFRSRAEVSVRWTGPAPVVDRVRVVRRWPA